VVELEVDKGLDFKALSEESFLENIYSKISMKMRSKKAK